MFQYVSEFEPAQDTTDKLLLSPFNITKKKGHAHTQYKQKPTKLQPSGTPTVLTDTGHHTSPFAANPKRGKKSKVIDLKLQAVLVF